MTWPKHRTLLLGIFLLGLSFRLAHFWAISHTAFPELPLLLNQTDMYANTEWARAILAGDWLGRTTYHPYFNWMRERGTAEAWYRWWGGQTILQQAPLYPYWLAGWFSVLGESLPGVLFVQLVFGSLDCIVIYCLARLRLSSMALMPSRRHVQFLRTGEPTLLPVRARKVQSVANVEFCAVDLPR